MGREENVIIFQDTEKKCKSVDSLSAAIKHSTEAQKLILENEAYMATDLKRYEGEAKLIVSKKRSYEAASAYKGSKVCVHNFASASNPGGGVVRGSTAQEECLCRCSTLYFSLNTKKMWDGFYVPHRAEHNPLHNDDCIYTPGVVVFKTDTASPSLMPEDEWFSVDVITCAAPNLREKPSNMMNSGDGHRAARISDKDLLSLHEKRLIRILDIALAEGNEVVILGAFGCGAFENKPEIVARAAKNVISRYMHSFKTIEFAVYCSPRDDSNFKVFERTMK